VSRPDEARLARAILGRAGVAAVCVAESREWRTATFAGLHHRMDVVATAEAGRGLARLAPEALRVPGQIVADLRVVASVPAGAAVRLTLEALVVHAC